MTRSRYVTIEREELDLLLEVAADWLEDAKTGFEQGYYENEYANADRLAEIIAVWSA